MKIFKMRSESTTGVIPKTEEEEPLEENQISEKRLSNAAVEKLEQSVAVAERVHGMLMKDKAVKMIIGLLIALALLVAADVWTSGLGLKNSGTLLGLFDLCKFIISTLLGYCFSIEVNKAGK